MRYDSKVCGVPRDIFVKALNAEGIPAMSGYKIPLHRQSLFLNKAFGPYTGYQSVRPDLDYRTVSCPVAEELCDATGLWLPQSVMLGAQQDMDDIVKAFRKVYEHRKELSE